MKPKLASRRIPRWVALATPALVTAGLALVTAGLAAPRAAHAQAEAAPEPAPAPQAPAAEYGPPPGYYAQAQGSDQAPVPPHVEGAPVASAAGTFCYGGAHPVDTRVAAGGPWDETQGPHSHTYPPFDLRLFVLKDGCYHFIGDPRDFGYRGQVYSYYGAHPVLETYGGGWCFMIGGHAHGWRPWSPYFVTVGPWFYWHGSYDPYFWSYWPYYATYYRSYYPHYYGGGRWTHHRGRRHVAVAPPVGPVRAPARAMPAASASLSGSARGTALPASATGAWPARASGLAPGTPTRVSPARAGAALPQDPTAPAGGRWSGHSGWTSQPTWSAGPRSDRGATWTAPQTYRPAPARTFTAPPSGLRLDNARGFSGGGSFRAAPMGSSSSGGGFRSGSPARAVRGR